MEDLPGKHEPMSVAKFPHEIAGLARGQACLFGGAPVFLAVLWAPGG